MSSESHLHKLQPFHFSRFWMHWQVSVSDHWEWPELISAVERPVFCPSNAILQVTSEEESSVWVKRSLPISTDWDKMDFPRLAEDCLTLAGKASPLGGRPAVERQEASSHMPCLTYWVTVHVGLLKLSVNHLLLFLCVYKCLHNKLPYQLFIIHV